VASSLETINAKLGLSWTPPTFARNNNFAYFGKLSMDKEALKDVF
jgi:hypothetical protein